jgi:hypothetical protein
MLQIYTSSNIINSEHSTWEIIGFTKIRGLTIE